MADCSWTVQMAALRSLDDFLLGSARFQLPPVHDLKRWSHRVVQNLLYYQTNYLVVALVVFLAVGVCRPRQLLLGAAVVAAALVAVLQLSSRQQQLAELRRRQPLVWLAAAGVLCCLVVYVFGAVLVLALAFCLPVSVVFVHASLRLRNFNNKLANKIESLGIRRSPMGALLGQLGIDAEKYLL